MVNDNNIYEFLESLIVRHLLVKIGPGQKRVKKDVDIFLKLGRYRNSIPPGPVILISTKKPEKAVCFFLNKQEFKSI